MKILQAAMLTAWFPLESEMWSLINQCKYLTSYPGKVPAQLSESPNCPSYMGNICLFTLTTAVLLLPNQDKLQGSILDAEMGGQRREAGI